MKKYILVCLLLATVVSLSFMSCEKKEQINMVEISYSGEDLTNEASIERNKETKSTSLKIGIEGNWKLYAGESVDSIDLTKAILEGSKVGAFTVNVPKDKRYYFLLETEKGTSILAEKHLPMAGGYNFRDLGGYKNKDGKYIKWGKIFRSDDLHQLTDADLDYLSTIPLITIVDFRSKQEIESAPDKNPKSLKQNSQLSIAPGNVLAFEKMAEQKPAALEQAMVDMNVMFVTDSAIIAMYKEYFTLLQSDKDVPLMFHCSAGKDRTGMGAALTLYALGVDEETIMKDYLLSNVYLADKYAKHKEAHPNLAPLFEVNEKYLKAGLDKIKEDHGSIDNYLTNILGVDITKMREKFLF